MVKICLNYYIINVAFCKVRTILLTPPIREKNKPYYEGGDFMESSSSFNIGKLNVKLGETHLHIAYGVNGWNANIAYSHIQKVVKYIVEKMQVTETTV